MEFDAGDGKGYRTVSQGNRITATYDSGIYELKMQATLTNGVVLRGHTLIKAIGAAAITRGEVVTNISYSSISAEYENETVSGRLWSRIRNGSSVTRPFIVVEGFDPEEFATNREKLENGYGLLNIHTFLELLQGNPSVYNKILNNYDIFYLDMENSTSSLESNAALFETAIQKINERKTSNEKNIVMGQSMGGLIAWIGLRNMEMNGKKHETSLFISHDAPYLGANVPLGALYAARGIIGIYDRYVQDWKNIDEVSKMQAVMHSKAVQQMLFHYVTEQGVINLSERSKLRGKLISNGQPKGDNGDLRCIAISNGCEQIISPQMTLLKADASGSPSDILNGITALYGFWGGFGTGIGLGIATKDWKNFVLGCIPGRSTLKGSIEINPTGSGRSLCDIRLTYKKKMLWLVNAQHTFYQYVKQEPTNQIGYDIAKGSPFSIKDLSSNAGGGSLASLIDYNWNVKVADRILFVPTASALYLGAGKANITSEDFMKTYDMTFYPEAPKQTPFDAYYIDPEANHHYQITPQMWNWIDEQMKMDISGSKIAVTGTTYTVRNNTHNYPVTWSSSDTSVATIGSNGKITMHKHGYITITATCYDGEMQIKYHKDIMVGMPSYVIKSEFQENQYRITYNAAESVPAEYASNLKIQMAIQSTNGSLSWKDCPTGQYLLPVQEQGITTNVYFRIISGTGITGNTSYVTICTSKPYITEPNYFMARRTSVGTVTIKKNPYYTGTIPEDLRIYGINVMGGTSEPVPYLPLVTEYTLKATNVFLQSEIEMVQKDSSKSKTNRVEIRGKKGNILQRFDLILSW